MHGCPIRAFASADEQTHNLLEEIEKSIELASKIKAVETADKMTAKQIAARVREVFAAYVD